MVCESLWGLINCKSPCQFYKLVSWFVRFMIHDDSSLRRDGRDT